MPSVICADDDPTVLRTYQKILESRGYDVRTCSNGAQAISMFAHSPADLILLDLMMPVKSGMAALKELRARPDTANVPIIVVSGLNNEQAIVDSMDGGADDFLPKPINPNELMAKVAIAMRRRGATSSETDGKLAEGSLFADRYRIIRAIGTGGFGQIYGAEDITGEFPGDLALKVFDTREIKRQNKAFLPVLLREASSLITLEHPNIIRMYDFGQTGRFYYLVMEFAEGQPLDTVILKHGALPSDAVALIGYHVASVLEYLGQQGIVHRDIKPDNIMITAQSELKLIDFGLAKHQGEKTLAGNNEEFRGTAQFVSPEQIQGAEDIDVRADIYSLGVTLYFVATAVNPFQDDSPMQMLLKHMEDIPPPACEVNLEVDTVLSDLIDRMIAKDREDRPGLTEIIQTLGGMLVDSAENSEKSDDSE